VRTDRFLLIRNYYWERPLWNSVDSINSQTWTGYLHMHQQGQLTAAQTFLFQEPRPYEEFYDLQTDPHSLKNVIDDPRLAAQINDLRIRLDNWRVETDDRMPDKPRRDGWTRDGRPLPHNQPWYDRYIEALRARPELDELSSRYLDVAQQHRDECAALVPPAQPEPVVEPIVEPEAPPPREPEVVEQHLP